jgi:hypothetical protein
MIIHKELSDRIIGLALTVHRILGSGLGEILLRTINYCVEIFAWQKSPHNAVKRHYDLQTP